MNAPRLKHFSPLNPSGDAPGMEAVRIDILKAGVENAPPAPPLPPTPTKMPEPPKPTVLLVNKNIRLPADLVDYIDYVYTRDNRMKKQDAYALAIQEFVQRAKSKATS